MSTGKLFRVLKTKDEFDEVTSGSGVSVIHFFASWADQCAPIEDALQVLSEELSEVSFFKVDAEEMSDVAIKNKISAVPTVLIFSSGKVIKKLEGSRAVDVAKAVRECAKPSPGQQQQQQPAKQLDKNGDKDHEAKRIKQLINSSKCMLFMKGTAANPKCGFSRETVAILDGLKADYQTFNILENENIRQALKTYSNWPTYPQLYVDGNLVGGLDIIKEMNESGELAPLVPKRQDMNSRLKDLISSHDVMVFMKGSPDAPRCGFSKTLMELLKETGIDFGTFDILTDEDVRSGLKTYSNWPTYPQLYVKSQLIGGVDIVKELKENDELAATLRGEQ